MIKYIRAFFVFVFEIIKNIALLGVSIWKTIKNNNFWFAFFAQPGLTLFILSLFQDISDNVIVDGRPNIKNLIILLLLTVLISVTIRMVVECCYYLFNRTVHFEKLIIIEHYFNNYIMIIVSLYAILLAVNNATEKINNILLHIGIYSFINNAVCDIYNVFIYKKEVAKTIVKKIRKIVQNDTES